MIRGEKISFRRKPTASPYLWKLYLTFSQSLNITLFLICNKRGKEMQFRTWVFLIGIMANVILLNMLIDISSPSTGFSTVDYDMWENNTYYVNINENGFFPDEIYVKQGDNVTWINGHKNVAILFSNNVDARFTSRIIYTGENYSFKYEKAGVYPYAEVNFGFKGKTVVKERGKAALQKEQQSMQEKQESVCSAFCAPGCTLSADGCSCSCPCYTDSDCNDNNPCTSDKCGLNPVRCENAEIKECRTEIIEENKEENKGETSSTILTLMGFTLLLAALVYLLKILASQNIKKGDKNIKKRKK